MASASTTAPVNFASANYCHHLEKLSISPAPCSLKYTRFKYLYHCLVAFAAYSASAVVWWCHVLSIMMSKRHRNYVWYIDDLCIFMFLTWNSMWTQEMAVMLSMAAIWKIYACRQFGYNFSRLISAASRSCRLSLQPRARPSKSSSDFSRHDEYWSMRKAINAGIIIRPEGSEGRFHQAMSFIALRRRPWFHAGTASMRLRMRRFLRTTWYCRMRLFNTLESLAALRICYFYDALLYAASGVAPARKHYRHRAHLISASK